MEQDVVTCKLTDGRTVLIRTPTERDLDKLLGFYRKLPLAVKNHLRYDVGADRETSAGRVRQIDGFSHWRVSAQLQGQEGEFVADGTMDREPFGWTRHVAHVRVVVDPTYEGLGAREAICEELVRRAQKAGVERLETQVLTDHEAYFKFLQTLGFTREFVRRNFAKGIDGKLRDVIIMSNDLESVWKHLEDSIKEMDLSFSKWSGQY